MVTSQLKDITERIMNSVVARRKGENDCASQQATQMISLVTRKVFIIFDKMVMVYQISTKET